MNKNERRELIVDCAKALFVRNGFHNTSVADIISNARIARSTFYAHFADKVDIFNLLVDRLTAILLDAILGINISSARKGSDLDLEIREMTIRLVEELDKNRDLTLLLINAPQGHDNVFDNKVAGFYSGILKGIKSLLVEGMGVGNIRRLEPDIVSYAILGSIKQILLQWFTYRDIDDIYGVIDDIIRFFLYGISKVPVAKQN
jgi:AcrR family transcriptional regulator